MKQPLLTLLCLNDDQLTNNAIKYAKLNAVFGAFLILASIPLYFIEMKPMMDEMAESYSESAISLIEGSNDIEHKTASEFLLICAEMYQDTALDISISLFILGLILLFSGLMYYRFHVLFKNT